MVELFDARTAVPYLADRIGIDPDRAVVTPLGGGVSNVVLAVDDGARSVVLKQALHRLRVADEWTAPQERAESEAWAMTLAATLVPGSVPEVVHHDPDRHALVVARAPASWTDWKSRLLAGEIDPAVAARIGDVVGRWHRATLDGAGVPPRMRAAAAFEQLRVEPYYRTAARRAPTYARALLAHAAALAAPPRPTLVHGDLSPKNVLVGDRTALIIDFEVAHLGDPAFDLAFLLSHLTLKSIHRPEWTEAFRSCTTVFAAAYTASAGAGLTPDWPRVHGHVGCLLIARVHGKSPAEYLTAPQRETTVARGAALLHHPPSHVEELFA
ncbi:phosphotransferase [Asanoa sp. NPDC050611]|uniref:phosphotransferase family protein n=1 Tax=Asanoa sp. NPDC050611 TaxID=3157098 RepID=UPI0033FBE79D